MEKLRYASGGVERKVKTPIHKALPPQVFLHMLSFLRIGELLRMERVSKALHRVVQSKTLWEGIVRRPPKHGERRMYLPDTRASHHREVAFELLSLCQKQPAEVIDGKYLWASSTDHPSQSIENVVSANPKFWSSTGSEAAHSESCVISIVQPLTIVTSVSIKPYKASYQLGLPCYAPRSFRVSVGFTPEDFHWTSEPMVCVNEPRFQELKINPRVVHGGYVKLEFVGKHQIQRGDEKHYVAIERIRIMGIPVDGHESALNTSLVDFALSRGLNPGSLVGEKSVSSVAQNPKEARNEVLRALWQTSKRFNSRMRFERQLLKRIRGLIERGKYMTAGVLVVGCQLHNMSLRNTVASWVKERHKAADTKGQPGTESPVAYVIPFIKRNARLTHKESYFVGVIDCLHPNEGLITEYLEARIVRPSEELGDFYMQQKQYHKAGTMYQGSNVPDKVLDALIMMGDFSKVVNVATQLALLDKDIVTLVQRVTKMRCRDDAVYLANLLIEAGGVSRGTMKIVAENLGIANQNCPNWDPFDAIEDEACSVDLGPLSPV
ncbi:hypothetical protein AAMO2058_001730100 [Amorphochlora amoebiformis]